jgi:quinol monooxygenase YgiN
MDGAVSWVVEGTIKPGQREPFRALMEEMAAATRADPGALIYEWFVNDGGDAACLYERYADSAAALAHVALFAAFAERFGAALDVTRFTVMGSPSDEVRAALSDDPPTYLRPLGGFAR